MTSEKSTTKTIKVGQFVDLSKRHGHYSTKWREVLHVEVLKRSFDDLCNIVYASDSNSFGILLYMQPEAYEVCDRHEIDVDECLRERPDTPALYSSEGITSYKYGTPYETAGRVAQGREYDDRVEVDRSTKKFYSFLQAARSSSPCHIELDCFDHMIWGVEIYLPIPVENSSRISLYLTKKDYDRKRRTEMKAGRAFKHMFNTLTDKQIAHIAESYIERSTPRDLTLKVGGDVGDFDTAYNADRASYRNPGTTQRRKSIASSCMHNVHVNSIDYGTMSPAIVYGSGDFKVAWLEDTEGRVAGRVVYSDVCGADRDNAHHAPLYGACEQSLDMLQAHLDSIGSSPCDHDLSEWIGLRLLNIECTDSGLNIAPYLDGEIGGRTCHKYIYLTDHSRDVTFDSTDGVVSGGTCCNICGSMMPEDESYHTDYDGPLCEVCFDENYTYTVDGDLIGTDRAVYANYTIKTSSSFRVDSGTFDEDDVVYCDDLNDYWHSSDVEYSDSHGVYIPTHMTQDYPEYFPDLYPTDDDEDENEDDDSNGQADKDSVEYDIENLPVKKEAA